MKMKQLLLCIASTGLLFAVSSCSKYEEGSGLSLIPKQTRIEELWKLERYSLDGIDKTDSAFYFLGYDYHLRFSDVNEWDYSESIRECEGCSDQISWTGKWSFENDKEDILLKPNGREIGERRFRIKRLSASDLYLERTNEKGVVERLEFSNVLEESEEDDKKDDKNKWN